MLEFFSSIRSVAAVLLVGNLLIVCHELGHLWVARLAGVQAKCFSIGFGPTLARRTDRRGTVWSLSLLPLGGFVVFEGERDSIQPFAYASKRPLIRMAIIAAGPAANILVALLTFGVMLAVFGSPGLLPVISTVVPGSAAEKAGFHVDDRVLTMDGKAIASFEDMRPGLRDNPGKLVSFAVERGGKVVNLHADLQSVQQDGKTIGMLGVTSARPFHQRLLATEIIEGAFEKTWDAVSDSINGISTLLVSGQGADNIAGMVGIAQLTGQVAQQGTGPFLALVAILSANLALMNLLPIPVLDGGAFLFCFAELVLRRPLSTRVQEFGTRAGLAVLVSLFMLTTLHDIYETGVFRWMAHL